MFHCKTIIAQIFTYSESTHIKKYKQIYHNNSPTNTTVPFSKSFQHIRLPRCNKQTMTWCLHSLFMISRKTLNTGRPNAEKASFPYNKFSLFHFLGYQFLRNVVLLSYLKFKKLSELKDNCCSSALEIDKEAFLSWKIVGQTFTFTRLKLAVSVWLILKWSASVCS